MESKRSVGSERRVPLWLKWSLTAFVAVLVPKYWIDYGPTNFLFFCDLALFLTLAAVWREESLWASMAAVGILIPQTIWIADFLGCMAGRPLVGATSYMFDSAIPWFTRALSFFHFWLPILLVWLVWRLGYDRRALRSWTALAWGVLLVCYFFMPAPPAPASDPNLPVNINFVHGLSDQRAQEWLPGPAYFSLLLVGLPALVYAPTHWALARWRPVGTTGWARGASSERMEDEAEPRRG